MDEGVYRVADLTAYCLAQKPAAVFFQPRAWGPHPDLIAVDKSLSRMNMASFARRPESFQALNHLQSDRHLQYYEVGHIITSFVTAHRELPPPLHAYAASLLRGRRLR